ncbi:MAG: fibronectin type III domain-containing protein [Oscillospiraceae bacterium]|nr:fibronectin type III domain-containing protein [Oscillospiraceae bacterium]
MKKINKIIIAAISAVILALSAMFVPACAASYGIRAEKRTEDSIRLVWEEQEGADGYRVYKYDTAQGKYVTYKSMATASCTITDLSSNTSYRFKIRSLVKDESGKYVKLTESGAVTVKTREKVVSAPKPVAEDKEETISEKKTRLKKELSEAKRELSSAESEVSSCEKKIASYQKTIETKKADPKSNPSEYAEIEKAKEGIEAERRRHDELTNKVSVCRAKVNRLTSQLHSMGVTDI